MQAQEKIRFKKADRELIFYKMGAANDSLATNDEFLFLSGDSARDHLSLEVENGLLRTSKNDSILVFRHMPGMRYETFYQHTLNAGVRTCLIKTVPDGASSLPHNSVRIIVRDRKKGLILIENQFIIR